MIASELTIQLFPKNEQPSLLGRLSTAIVLLCGLVSPPANAKTVSVAQAPVAWRIYAQNATRSITQWLNSDDAVASGFRTNLGASRPHADNMLPELLIKVWVGPKGILTGVTALPPTPAGVEEDLRAILVGRHLAPPPRHMRLPMRLGLQLYLTPTAGEDTVRREALLQRDDI